MKTLPPNISAMILAGGLGTRLKSVVADRPKVLAPIAGRPFLAYLLDRLAAAGLRHAVICSGYRADQLEREFGASHGSMMLSWSRETTPLGTGGALRLGLPLARSATVLALNGDSYCAANLADFYAWHAKRGEAGSLLLVEVPDTSRYGSVVLDGRSRITSFTEKGASGGPGLINAGIYLFEAGLLQQIPEGRMVSLERDLLPAWIAQGLGGHVTQAPFLDIGTPESYAQAAQFVRGLHQGG
jgi:NDP-sugar pyrophosphorylase family protein